MVPLESVLIEDGALSFAAELTALSSPPPLPALKDGDDDDDPFCFRPDLGRSEPGFHIIARKSGQRATRDFKTCVDPKFLGKEKLSLYDRR